MHLFLTITSFVITDEPIVHFFTPWLILYPEMLAFVR